MSLAFDPVRIANGENAQGVLVWNDGVLIAVVSQLSNMHGELARYWYVEYEFGGTLENHIFADLKQLEDELRRPH